MVPSPNVELLDVFSPRIITETCRNKVTRINGFALFDLLLGADLSESADTMRSRSVPEKSLYREHVRPASCTWKFMVSVRPYIRPAGMKNCRKMRLRCRIWR